MITAADLSRLHTETLQNAFQMAQEQQVQVSKILSEVFPSTHEIDMAERECPTHVLPAWVLGDTYEQVSTVTMSQLRDELRHREITPRLGDRHDLNNSS